MEELSKVIIRNTFLECGAQDVDYNDSWVITWVDGAVPMERFSKLKSYQKINHFPGISEICKKDLLAMNLKRMKMMFNKEYNFFPLTFCLPEEGRSLLEHCKRRNRREIFIIKPVKNCQGSGIDIVKGIDDVKKYRNVVCQKYITTPLLMDRFKMDLRLYVLITSISPLRIYLYREGLVRLATVPYKKPNATNLQEKRMHLTNYAINRNPDENCTENWSRQNCKKSFAELEAFLDSIKVDRAHLWPSIDGIIVKTVLSALPVLRHMYRTCFPVQPATSPCFEVLGFDVLLDSTLKPYLLEVNRSPSLEASGAMDRHLKRNLIRNTIDMLLPTPRQISLLDEEQHRKAVRRLTSLDKTKHLTTNELIVAEHQEKREAKKMDNFRQIYPVEDGKYEPIIRALLPNPPRRETGDTERKTDSSDGVRQCVEEETRMQNEQKMKPE